MPGRAHFLIIGESVEILLAHLIQVFLSILQQIGAVGCVFLLNLFQNIIHPCLRLLIPGGERCIADVFVQQICAVISRGHGIGPGKDEIIASGNLTVGLPFSRKSTVSFFRFFRFARCRSGGFLFGCLLGRCFRLLHRIQHGTRCRGGLRTCFRSGRIGSGTAAAG